MTFSGLDALAATGSVFDFAQANGLKFQRRSLPPMLSGGPFERYTNTKVRGSVTGPGWLVGQLDLGDGGLRKRVMTPAGEVTYGWGSGIEVAPHKPVGYLAVTLPRPLPNMILDSVGNNSLFGSSLMYPPERDQRLSLEGDFDDYFDLYVPRGYERDALYIFTPDLMALLIDESADADVEIRGNQFVAYVPGGLDLSSADTWRWIERLLAILLTKTHSRADGYSDERAASAPMLTIAPAGQHLRRRAFAGENRRVFWRSARALLPFFVVGLGSLIFWIYSNLSNTHIEISP